MNIRRFILRGSISAPGRMPRVFLQALSIFIIIISLSSCGPHMITQPSIAPYSARMPVMSSRSVPVSGSMKQITLQQSRLTSNPIPRTKQNLESGRIYYGYYCLMCHGDRGRGDGPVGVSYQPKASDLTTVRVFSLSDGEIYRRMLKGTGHDPVMEETVQPDERWPIVLYIRSLQEH